MPLTLRLLAALALLAPTASAQSALVIGGGTDEWDERTPAATDPADDAGAGNSDLSRLWIESDADFLYLAFEIAAPALLSDGNSLRLTLDADDDSGTGSAADGVGAELVWRFGDRRGTVYSASGARSVEWADIAFWTAPQITSTRFEMALPRNAAPGVLPVVTGDRVRVVVSSGSDRIEAAADLTEAGRVRGPVVLDKQSPDHVRVLAYNVLRDRLFDGSAEGAFTRVLRAIRPDVVVFSEIYDAGAAQTAARLASLLGEPASEWFAAKAGPDIIVVARTPVTRVAEVAGNGLFRVAAPDGGASDWIVAGMHPPCCTNDDGRQDEVDAMIAAIRNARASGTIPADAPLVVAGDMNFVGQARQLDTLFGGDILNEARYGADAPPDTDGSAITDAAPQATGVPAAFTWRSPPSDFPPGQLDYLAYSDAALGAGRTFVLYTPGLTDAERAETGLQANDAAGRTGSDYASDHLPVVVDLFALPGTSTEAGRAAAPVEIVGVSPQPASGSMRVLFRSAAPGPATVALYDALGRRVLQQTATGGDTVTLDTARLAAGVYVVRVKTERGAATRRVIVGR